MSIVAAVYVASVVREITPEDRKEIEGVLDAASDCALGLLPLEAFAKVGTMLTPLGRVSAAYTRHVAVVATPAADPRRKALLRAIDDLLRLSGLRFTNFGCFDCDELSNVTIRYGRREP